MSEEVKKKDDDCAACTIVFIMLIIIAVLGGLYYNEYQEHKETKHDLQKQYEFNRTVKYLDGTLNGKCFESFNKYYVINSLEDTGYNISQLIADRDVVTQKRITVKGEASVVDTLYGPMVSCDVAAREVLKTAILSGSR